MWLGWCSGVIRLSQIITSNCFVCPKKYVHVTTALFYEPRKMIIHYNLDALCVLRSNFVRPETQTKPNTNSHACIRWRAIVTLKVTQQIGTERTQPLVHNNRNFTICCGNQVMVNLFFFGCPTISPLYSPSNSLRIVFFSLLFGPMQCIYVIARPTIARRTLHNTIFCVCVVDNRQFFRIIMCNIPISAIC